MEDWLLEDRHGIRLPPGNPCSRVKISVQLSPYLTIHTRSNILSTQNGEFISQSYEIATSHTYDSHIFLFPYNVFFKLLKIE